MVDNKNYKKIYTIECLFSFVGDLILNIDQNTFIFSVDNYTYTIKGNDETIDKSSEYCLIIGDFESNKEAEEYMPIAHKKLISYSFYTGSYIKIENLDNSTDKIPSLFRIKEKHIYPTVKKGNTNIHAVEAKFEINFRLKNLVARIKHSNEKDIISRSFNSKIKDYKLINALEAYNLSNLAKDLYVKFTLLVVAIESLKPGKPSEKTPYIGLLDSFIDMTNESEYSDDDKEILVKGLCRLKKISIIKTYTALVDEYFGSKTFLNLPASKFYKKCNNIRSDFVHNGERNINKYFKNNTEGSVLSQLNQFVRLLIKAKVFGESIEEA